jgi:putative two-component system response regulator
VTKESGHMDQALRSNYEKEIDSPFIDCLTGLLNHGFFRLCLEHEIKRFERHGSTAALALIDIDWFSAFNKRYGSLEGDRVLRDIAAAISANVREVDVAARFLGDIYAVLFIMSEAEQVQKAAERIRSAIEGATGGRLTVSIGLAALHAQTTADTLIDKARESLAQAKIRGKNRVHFFQEEQPKVVEDKPKVLVVDDEPLNLKLLEALLLGLEYDVIKAASGEQALQLVDKTDIDLILLDVMMPQMDGFEVCRRLKSTNRTRLIPVIMLTALSGTDAKVKGIEAGADDFITKPPNKMELLARTKSLIRVKTLNDDLTSIETVLYALANAIEARDPYTEGHVQRVAHLALALGERLLLPEREMKALKLGGILHDIGKIKVPDAILNKPGMLTPEERNVMETHANAGYQICLPLTRSLGTALDVIRYHHEKLDGSGYPVGLKGPEIPMTARIMAVVDIFDALVTDRPYRKGMSKEDALRIIRKMVDEGQLDAALVHTFVEMLDG